MVNTSHIKLYNCGSVINVVLDVHLIENQVGITVYRLGIFYHRDVEVLTPMIYFAMNI